MGRRIILIFTFVAMHIAALAQTVPFPTDNLQLWLRADSVELTDGKVSRWFDLSPNQYEIVQASADARPAIAENALNGMPAVSFNGVSTYLTGGDILDLGTDSWTWFVVGQYNTGNLVGVNSPIFLGKYDRYNAWGSQPVWTLGKEIWAIFWPNSKQVQINFSSNITSSAFSVFGYEILERAKSTNSIFNNNNICASRTYNGTFGSYNNDNPFKIGQSVISTASPNGNFLDGKIAEIIAFNTVDADLRDKVYDYLYDKYGRTSIDLGLDIVVPYGFADTAITTAYNPNFVSYLWNTGETDSVIHVSKPGSYWVTVTNTFGYTSCDTINVYYPEPEQLPDTTICAGDTLVWDAALNGPYTYLWCDGSTESSLEITTAGEYYVVITDTAGYSWKSETITVSIDSFPVTARLESENIEACIGNNIYLQNGYDEAVNYLWSDGTSADHLTVATTGTYWVKVTDRLGCKAADTVHIEVLGIAPTPDFTHTALCATRDIEFGNQSHSNDASQINGYLWQFGDGQTSAEASPAHAYSYSGTYNLQLTVSTTNGCRNLLKKTLIVDSLPTAAFTPEQACSFTTVQFADQSTTPVSYITDWQWAMNDSVFAVRNPSTTFSTWGDKPVQLVVATAHGCTDTLRGSISILQGPAVDFAVSEPCLNTPLYCTNRTIGALNLAVDYVWQIDGEERSTAKSPDFNFSDTGSYRITLTAKQLSNGCSASKSKNISIKPLPKPVIAAGLICHNQPTAVSAGNIEPQSVVRSWQWSVDGVQSAQKQSAWLTFESAGRHQLTVAATDTVGCVSKTDTTVVVRPTPAAAFGVTPERGPAPFEPRIINNTTDADNYLWLLNGETSDAEEPQHTFADSGSHTIRLVATNQFGCADTALRTIVAFVPNTDLLIMQAAAEPVGNYLRISAVVANNSPYDLANTTISCTDNLGHSMRETIADTLKSGKIVRYTFAAEIESASDLLKYICVNVEPATGSDANPADNQFCIAMVSDEFSIEPAKPNPANNLLKISYIVPQEGRVKIELFNQVGMSAATLFDGTAASGYNELLVDASVLKSGMYHYRITYGGRSRVGVVMIMHHR
ncbi:MAG: PKD domain-containing protein [Salinivirgaceae bacterium]|nr:PKD domain-containing protein [Salinivirgaceae bacterium]